MNRPKVYTRPMLCIAGDDPKTAKLELDSETLRLWFTHDDESIVVLDSLGGQSDAAAHDDAEYLRNIAAMLTVAAAAIERRDWATAGRLSAYFTAVREALSLATYDACVKSEDE